MLQHMRPTGLRLPRKKENGINPALPLLIIFVIIFVVAVSYLATPPQTSPPSHTYFQSLSFSLPIGQIWHVAVPISQDGNLQLSISANSTVEIFVKNGNSYLLDSEIFSDQNFTLPVTTSMNLLQVGVRNVGLQPALVEQFTCIWAPA